MEENLVSREELSEALQDKIKGVLREEYGFDNNISAVDNNIKMAVEFSILDNMVSNENNEYNMGEKTIDKFVDSIAEEKIDREFLNESGIFETAIELSSDSELEKWATNTKDLDVLEAILQKTESEEVLKAIAENENADGILLNRVVKYSDSEEVAIAASNNENSTIEVNNIAISKYGEDISGDLKPFFTDEQVQEFKDIMNEEQEAVKNAFISEVKADFESQYGENWESLEATGYLSSYDKDGFSSFHDEQNPVTLGEIVDRLDERYNDMAYDYLNDNAFIDNSAISLQIDVDGEPTFLKNPEDMRDLVKEHMGFKPDVQIEKVFEPANSESLDENIRKNNDLSENIDYAEKTVESETNKSEKYVEQEGSASKFSSEDEEKLKGLENADCKSLSDAIDIYKDGKFDNDSHGDKMGNREKHEQSMRM